LDNLFTNIYNKIITINKEPNVLLDKSKLEKGWYKIAEDFSKITIPVNDEDNASITFNGTDALSAITFLTIKIGKYLNYERLFPDFM